MRDNNGYTCSYRLPVTVFMALFFLKWWLILHVNEKQPIFLNSIMVLYKNIYITLNEQNHYDS